VTACAKTVQHEGQELTSGETLKLFIINNICWGWDLSGATGGPEYSLVGGNPRFLPPGDWAGQAVSRSRRAATVPARETAILCFHRHSRFVPSLFVLRPPQLLHLRRQIRASGGVAWFRYRKRKPPANPKARF